MPDIGSSMSVASGEHTFLCDPATYRLHLGGMGWLNLAYIEKPANVEAGDLALVLNSLNLDKPAAGWFVAPIVDKTDGAVKLGRPIAAHDATANAKSPVPHAGRSHAGDPTIHPACWVCGGSGFGARPVDLRVEAKANGARIENRSGPSVGGHHDESVGSSLRLGGQDEGSPDLVILSGSSAWLAERDAAMAEVSRLRSELITATRRAEAAESRVVLLEDDLAHLDGRMDEASDELLRLRAVVAKGHAYNVGDRVTVESFPFSWTIEALTVRLARRTPNGETRWSDVGIEMLKAVGKAARDGGDGDGGDGNGTEDIPESPIVAEAACEVDGSRE